MMSQSCVVVSLFGLMILMQFVNLGSQEAFKVLNEDLIQTHKPLKDDFNVVRYNGGIGDLINRIESNGYKASYRRNTILNFAEVADLLYEKINHHPTELRCQLYVNLVRQPNIRTAEKVSKLVEKSQLEYRSQQKKDSVVSLSTYLDEGIEYGALDKLRNLIQLFENETTNPDFKNKREVRLDILGCIAHFADRHVRAVEGVRHFIVLASEYIDPLVFDRFKSEHWTDVYMKQVEAIENNGLEHSHRKKADWLNAMDKLFVVMINNRYRLTEDVLRFVNQPSRKLWLTSMQVILNKIRNLQDKLIKQESDTNMNIRKSREYREDLLNLFATTAENIDWIPIFTSSFVYRPARFGIIKRRIMRFRGKTDPEIRIMASIDELNMLRGLKESCNILTKQLELSVNPSLYYRLSAYKAMSLRDRLYHYRIGCRAEKSDSSLQNKRFWLVYSITMKLTDWATRKISNPSTISEQDRRMIVELVRTLP